MRQTSDIASYWDCLQEPRRRSGFSAGYLRLLAALDSGWRVDQVTKISSTKPGGEADEYCFTLMKSEEIEPQTLRLPRSQELMQFISKERLLPKHDTPCFSF